MRKIGGSSTTAAHIPYCWSERATFPSPAPWLWPSDPQSTWFPPLWIERVFFAKWVILHKKYSSASVTVKSLLNLGALVLHNVDATVMAASKVLNGRLFDRIVYNFPHAGFFGSEDRKDVIRKHRLLMRKFFENAAKMLVPGGEVHVSHKDHGPYKKWKLAKQASKGCLELKESVKFDPADFPGYVNRRGDGVNSGKPFALGACRTFKFVYSAMLAAIGAFPIFSPSMLPAEGFYEEANQKELSQSGKRRLKPNLKDQECRASVRQRTETGWQETFFFRRSSVQVPVALSPGNFFGDFLSRPPAIVRRFKPYPPALPSPQSAPVMHHASRKLVLIHPSTQQQLFTLGHCNFNIQSCTPVRLVQTPMAHQSQHIVVQQHSSMPQPLPLRLL
ncbi:hypothetical protein O6H91_09G033200 [Diphasiastrum complanatum]|uniref:Uncharacterized protein n=1 Tax=Diphasiastrum complanatum TaxID=34168 RepID=A0ACC2CN15_DIPCM|nr:hypothetical protein O6H91_09G033200 [Diphasiastrum complanatum]